MVGMLYRKASLLHCFSAVNRFNFLLSVIEQWPKQIDVNI